jgi:hypothetical protein
MNPAEIAAGIYRQTYGPGAFVNTVARCLGRGLVISRHDRFLLAEPCFFDGDDVYYNTAHPSNCWLVYYATGDLRSILSDAPYLLEYIAFSRRGTQRVYQWEKLTGKF